MSSDARVTWTCEVSGPGHHFDLPDGADLPMRQAVRAAFRDVVGAAEDHLSSGWGRAALAAKPEPELELDRAELLVRATVNVMVSMPLLPEARTDYDHPTWATFREAVAAEYARLSDEGAEG